MSFSKAHKSLHQKITSDRVPIDCVLFGEVYVLEETQTLLHSVRHNNVSGNVISAFDNIMCLEGGSVLA
jgi:hypothetical protein